MLVHKSVLKRLLINLCCKAEVIHPLNQHILILKCSENMNLTIDHLNQLLTSQCNLEILIAEINQDGLNVSIIVIHCL